MTTKAGPAILGLATPSRTENERIAGVDLIRLVALFAVVVGHAYTDNQLIDRYLQSWRLPIFFVLSGFFWSQTRTLKSEVSKRTRTLIVPYLIWGVLIGFAAVAFFGFDPGDTAMSFALGGSYAQRPFTAFWFLTALFAAVVMLRLLDRMPAYLVWISSAALLLLNMLVGSYLALVPLSLATATGAIFFIQTGRFVAQIHQRVSVRLLQIVAVLLIAMCLVTLTMIPGTFYPLEMKRGNFPLLAVVISLILSASLVTLGTTIALQRRVGALVTALAKPSLVVIALHPLLLIAFSGKMPYFLVPVLAFGVSLLVGLAIVWSPISQALAGVPRSPLRRKLQTD